VSHLTVGETYFFRDNTTFAALAEQILPCLIDRMRSQKKMRIWSAACCTGEEPYSIAILLQRLLPDWEDWDISILATDINPRFLQVARAGVFGAWSFRDAPPWLKSQYFKPAKNGKEYSIAPEVRRMVQFATMNLVSESDRQQHDNAEMDLIFCRNALMYFHPGQARKVIQRLGQMQKPGGWLVVGLSELLHLSTFASLYRSITFQGTAFFQKHAPTPDLKQAFQHHRADGREDDEARRAVQIEPRRYATAAALFDKGCYAETIQTLTEKRDVHGYHSDELALLTRSLANQGLLIDALACCDRWLVADKLNADGHYFRAVILLEQDRLDDALRALRKVLHLKPDYAIAHYALANIARQRGHLFQARRHLTNALQLLRGVRPDEQLCEPKGLRAVDLMEIIKYLLRTGINV
jgi:chemotaxis protein methyltransferase CheR